MKPEEKSKNYSSVLLYVAATVVFLIGIASLVNNILNYNNTVAAYVAQGYTVDMVAGQLIPVKLLPGIFEAVGVYGGLGFALLGIGIMNKKVSIKLPLQDAAGDEPDEQNIPGMEDTEATEDTGDIEDTEDNMQPETGKEDDEAENSK